MTTARSTVKCHSELDLAERRLARAQQRLTENERLIRHHHIAMALLTLPPSRRSKLIAYAEARVQQWRDKGLCSRDYIDRWSRILSLPAGEMARAIVSDLDGWGTALRQNSPLRGVLPP